MRLFSLCDRVRSLFCDPAALSLFLSLINAPSAGIAYPTSLPTSLSLCVIPHLLANSTAWKLHYPPFTSYSSSRLLFLAVLFSYWLCFTFAHLASVALKMEQAMPALILQNDRISCTILWHDCMHANPHTRNTHLHGTYLCNLLALTPLGKKTCFHSDK